MIKNIIKKNFTSSHPMIKKSIHPYSQYINILKFTVYILNIIFTSKQKGSLIETSELSQILQTPSNLSNLRILDCSYYLPNDGRLSSTEFKTQRIPYSQLFDVDKIAETSSSLPHMMANDNTFFYYMEKMDIIPDDTIVCYDRLGIFSSPRVYINFRMHGCSNVYVLNGGLPKWLKEGLEVEKGEDYRFNTIKRNGSNSNVIWEKRDKSKVIDIDSLLSIAKHKKEQIIDCRNSERYNGGGEEPRPTIRKGHAPNAGNVFFKDMLDENSCYKSNNECLANFEKKGIDVDKPMTLYCGSGLTACVNIMALDLMGKLDNCRLYDGSWAELVGLFKYTLIQFIICDNILS